MKFCNKCGNQIEAGVKFCTKCGNLIKNIDVENEKPEENKINLVKEEKDIKREEKIEVNNIQPIEHVNRNNQTINNQHISKNNVKNNAGKSFFSGVIPKIIIGVVLILAILAGVFFNRIKCEYYIMKANDSVNVTEKIEYAIKAIKVLNTSETKDLLKSNIVELAKNDVELAEEKLNQVSSILSQGDFQNIAIGIKDKKIDKLYKDKDYQDAVSEFSELDKLGGDFKANKNYEDIMLNVISKLTNTPVSNTKSLLMDEKKIYFDNFDSDPFDEIIELKSNNNYLYNSEIKLNLYKLKNGQYKLVDTETIERAWNQKIQGVYNYAADKKGIFIYYSNASNSVGTSVFGVDNDKLKLKGAVFANNYTKPDDVDDDGIYEVLSNNTSVVTSSKKDNSKWYKIYEDSRTPTELTVTEGTKPKASESTGDYIFKDSDKSYLTENDVKNMSKEQIALARNEIFARHGYVFNDEQYRKYFSAKSWYVPNSSYDGSDSSLNQYEIANYQLMQTWEKK